MVQDARLGVMAGGAGMQFHQPSFRRRVLDIEHLCPGCTGVDPAEIVPERLGHLVDDFPVEIAAYGDSDRRNPCLDRFSVCLALDLARLNHVAVAELSRPFVDHAARIVLLSDESKFLRFGEPDELSRGIDATVHVEVGIAVKKRQVPVCPLALTASQSSPATRPVVASMHPPAPLSAPTPWGPRKTEAPSISSCT